MSDPITRNFNASLQKTYEWLQHVEDALSTDDRPTAYHALRAVLHALRDRLTPVEACELAAELPAMLRGIYFEGWSPAEEAWPLAVDGAGGGGALVRYTACMQSNTPYQRRSVSYGKPTHGTAAQHT